MMFLTSLTGKGYDVESRCAANKKQGIIPACTEHLLRSNSHVGCVGGLQVRYL